MSPPIQPDRFFHEERDAPLNGEEFVSMGEGRKAKEEGIQLHAVQHRPRIGEGSPTKALGGVLRLFGDDIAKRHHFNAVHLRQSVEVLLGDATTTDESDPNDGTRHRPFPLCRQFALKFCWRRTSGEMEVLAMGNGMTRRTFVKLGTAALAFRSVANLSAQPKPLRVAFIGVGGRGTVLLRETLQLPAIQVVAICDVEPSHLERACQLVEQAQGKRPDAYGKHPYHYRELLQRPDIDAVVFATPCYWHGMMYLDAMAAGKHFYGEKPLAITVRELKRLQEARQRYPPCHRANWLSVGSPSRSGGHRAENSGWRTRRVD